MYIHLSILLNLKFIFSNIQSNLFFLIINSFISIIFFSIIFFLFFFALNKFSKFNIDFVHTFIVFFLIYEFLNSLTGLSLSSSSIILFLNLTQNLTNLIFFKIIIIVFILLISFFLSFRKILDLKKVNLLYSYCFNNIFCLSYL